MTGKITPKSSKAFLDASLHRENSVLLFTCVSLQCFAQQYRRCYLLVGALQKICVCNKDLAHSIQTPMKKKASQDWTEAIRKAHQTKCWDKSCFMFS